MFREIRVICVRIKKTCVQGLANLGGQYYCYGQFLYYLQYFSTTIPCSMCRNGAKAFLLFVDNEKFSNFADEIS